jgi:hypothetical protein
LGHGRSIFDPANELADCTVPLLKLGPTLVKGFVNRFRRSISAPTLISDRFTLAIVVSGEKTE